MLENSTVTSKPDLILSLAAALAENGLDFVFSPAGHVIGVFHPENATLPRLAGLGAIVEGAALWETQKQWVIGDLINLGDFYYGDDFAQFLPADQTLYNWSSICRQYSHAERWFKLPFSFYAEVAFMKNKRERADLLLIAQERKLTTAQLRALKNASSGNPTDAPPIYVTGMKRYPATEALRLNLINDEEYERGVAAGLATFRLEYTGVWEA